MIHATIEKIKNRQKEILDDSDNNIMETNESLGGGNVVKSQVIIKTPNKDIFEVGNDEAGGSEGRISSRVCEVKPLPRENDTAPVVSVEIKKVKHEELDISGEND